MKEKIEEIYNKFSKPLLYFIYKKISNKTHAQDLLQDVFLKAYKNINTLEDKDNIQAWLYKIANNTIIDYYRKNEIASIQEYDLKEEELEESVLSELSCCLGSVINKLPKQQADVLKEVYFNDLSLLEYSQKNNMNLSTVKSHSKRAKEKLKKIFYECCNFEKDSLNQIVDYKHKGSKCLC